ncbi:MAG: DUF58 domain-containing protein [Ruminococcus sp.]|nr:DUF58 domain-containing protein [Ruminococcus sp.]
MFLTKILFIVLIIICAAFYILYIWDFALVLLIVMIAIPVIMFLSVFITKKLISAEFALKDNTVAKNEPFPVQLCINNRSILPIGKAEVRIEYYNLFSNQITSFDLFVPIQARNSQRVTFQLNSRFCGIINIRTVYINIFDPLRIFRFRIGKGISTQISVMPEGHEINGTVNYTDRVNEESSMFSENKPGDDPSEVFDLREYIPGDKLNRIHWKLSSKKDDFIVKDYSLPIDVPSTIFLNLKCYEDSEYTLPVFDTLIETLISLSQFMLENERMHNVIYYSSRYKNFIEKTINAPDELAELVKEIIDSFSDNLYCKCPEDYLYDNSLSLASFVFLSSVPDGTVLPFIDENIDADIKNAVLVVRSVNEAAELTDSYSNLNIIPVVIGRITSSIKDIEL